MSTASIGMGLGLVGVLGVLACEAQVGSGYEGEVQFAVEGTTTSDVDSEMRPRLAFPIEGGMVFVKGTVTGSFPRKFRFEVTEPPQQKPDSAVPIRSWSRSAIW